MSSDGMSHVIKRHAVSMATNAVNSITERFNYVRRSRVYLRLKMETHTLDTNGRKRWAKRIVAATAKRPNPNGLRLPTFSNTSVAELQQMFNIRLNVQQQQQLHQLRQQQTHYSLLLLLHQQLEVDTNVNWLTYVDQQISNLELLEHNNKVTVRSIISILFEEFFLLWKGEVSINVKDVLITSTVTVQLMIRIFFTKKHRNTSRPLRKWR